VLAVNLDHARRRLLNGLLGTTLVVPSRQVSSRAWQWQRRHWQPWVEDRSGNRASARRPADVGDRIFEKFSRSRLIYRSQHTFTRFGLRPSVTEVPHLISKSTSVSNLNFRTLGSSRVTGTRCVSVGVMSLFRC
jgi:hypothetical protein